MTHVVEAVVEVTTSSSGAVTGYTSPVTGIISAIVYEPSTLAALATGVALAITMERTGIGLWSQTGLDAAKTVSPTQPIHTQAGVARLASSAAPLTEIGGPIAVANDRVKVAITGGGDAKSGTFRVLVA